MKKEHEVCTASSIGIEITGADAQPVLDALNEYLSVFAAPAKKGNGNFLSGSIECLKCGKPLGGTFGSFQWGIVHGEGSCSNCGWPGRAIHHPKDEEGEIFDRGLEIILQYHPSGVESIPRG